ncbi:WD40-like Beta Propeller Repeat [Fodinibius salinus]|uniref:WD40-like Beta Propeller Repeat n=1 Tax=Fodinibius salinus TaxID=860790 RepID=A0A5D3YN76_9BACT|nr:DUF5050 domain-containing protein [Fodinibius salinus]TYP95586.1 WD40-like Beta Propeller Repeat [Fodinibius salinus]
MKRLLQLSILILSILFIFSCGGDDGHGPTNPNNNDEPTTGAVEVTTSSTGDDIDGDGYTVSAGGTSKSVSSSGTVILAGLSEGDVNTELSGMAGNCAVKNGSNSQTVTITAGDTTSTSFDVECQAAADGKIAFTSDRDGDQEVFLMNTDGSTPTKQTDNTAADFAGPISPNGTKIAFVSNRGGSTTHLYVMDADGSNVQQLTAAGAKVSLLGGASSWSPDGSSLAFVDERSGNLEIYTIGADGSGEQRLTNNSAGDESPHWSPDGSKIVYASKTDGDFEIYSMNPDGSDHQQITSDTDYNATPRWSPDGSTIAFTSDRSGNLEIHTMNADGNDVQQLTNDPASDGLPSWSPDGSELAFYSTRDGNYEVYKTNADGSDTSVKLTDHSAADNTPYWSPVE